MIVIKNPSYNLHFVGRSWIKVNKVVCVVGGELNATQRQISFCNELHTGSKAPSRFQNPDNMKNSLYLHLCLLTPCKN